MWKAEEVAHQDTLIFMIAEMLVTKIRLHVRQKEVYQTDFSWRSYPTSRTTVLGRVAVVEGSPLV